MEKQIFFVKDNSFLFFSNIIFLNLLWKDYMSFPLHRETIFFFFVKVNYFLFVSTKFFFLVGSNRRKETIFFLLLVKANLFLKPEDKPYFFQTKNYVPHNTQQNFQ